MERAPRWHDYITINIYWFALTLRAQVLSPLVIPLLVQSFVGEAAKGAYVGQMRLGALMVAVLIQALVGMLSDRCTSRWGRRRPFIFVGALAEAVIIMLIGYVAGMSGMRGYWALFGLYVLSMVSANTAHAATQGLIPDLVPQASRGRFSGVKALLELPVPLIFVSLVIGGMISSGNLWGALILLAVLIVACMLVALFSPEQPITQVPFEMDWRPFLRLLLMTAAFTLVILGLGAVVNAVMRLPTDISSRAARWLVAGVGLLAMVLAVGLGVWLSVRISIGTEIKRRTSFVWWIVNRLAFLVAATNISGFMVYFLQERYVHLAGQQAAGPAAKIVMVVGLSILATALPSGWLADRFGTKRVVALAGILAMGGMAIVVLVPSFPAMYMGGALVGAATGMFYTANWALGTSLVPQEQAGRYLGLSNLAGAGAGAIGAYIGGPMADRTGYVLLFMIYGLMFLMSSLALIGVRPIESEPA